MEREIKFRAWEKDADNPQAKGLKGVMICNDHLMEFPVRLVNCIQNVKDRYILMQYTGLKDSKGVEIYEGDKDKHGRTVVYRNGCFHLVNGVGQTLDYLFNYTDMNGFIVDGNIYEPRNNE